MYWVSYYAVAVICFTALNRHLLDAKDQVNFVLVGATGNLAQKYLWHSLQAVSKNTAKYDYHFYGGARAPNDTGADALHKILSDDLQYDSEEEKEAFINSIQYTQLKVCDDYKVLCNSLTFQTDVNGDKYCETDGSCTDEHDDDHQGPDKYSKSQQIFYLSVPPYTYGDLAQCISSVCNTKLRDTKIVLEKPYGSDVKTVEELVAKLRLIYDDEDVYLVDHYLGKTVVRNILPFRYENREWLEPLLNRDHVARIEVVIKEKETAKGRLNYYDSYGVFLDILQNHAVELLTLVAMDIPPFELSSTSSIDLVKHKIKFLKSLAPISYKDVVYAQYKGYVSDGQMEFRNENFTSSTATFGGVLIRSSSRRWNGVPLLLLSGKALDAKSSYVRIVFKNNDFFSSTTGQPPNEIIFAISSNYNSEIVKPSIAISTNLIKVNMKSFRQWEKRENFHLKVYDEPDQAYFRVVDDVINARRENFVSLQQLKSSWEIWTVAVQLLQNLKEIKIYNEGDLSNLEFSLTASGLKFKNKNVDLSTPAVVKDFENAVVLGSELDVARTAVDLLLTLIDQVSFKRRDAFHIAFPGGKTPKLLFQLLASETSIPWEMIHVWFTDERCCSEDFKADLNFHNIYESLLQHVRIPSVNIHPMPVHLSGGLCVKDDKGDALYAKSLETSTHAERLDLVILGVGTDGHVASLFPNSVIDNENEVIFTEAPNVAEGCAKQRMTLTWSTIKTARSILVLITGEDKQSVVKELLEGQLTPEQFPVKYLLKQYNASFLISVEKSEN